MHRSSFLTVTLIVMTQTLPAESPVPIGSRRELMLDDFLIAEMKGAAALRLHRPFRREVALRTDQPWEGNACHYRSVFQDGDLYRMYYSGLHYQTGGKESEGMATHPNFLCLATSRDGIHWTRPELGLVAFNGSRANNIVLGPSNLGGLKVDPVHSSVFKDANPSCPPDAQYKAVLVGSKPHGLYLFKSPDGVHFSPMSDKPAITHGAFDSENLIFWDSVRGEYREYHRAFDAGVRGIMTATSQDILHFPDPVWVEFPGAPVEHLYTNQVVPYFRAPHLFVGFPMRYTDRGWTEALPQLPQLEERLARASHSRRYGTAMTDGLFMSSRDGVNFKRWAEAFIRPGPRKKGTWVYGDNSTAWGVVVTKSSLADAPDELSIYATEGYWRGTSLNVRRYSLRMDGFVSVQAPLRGGEVITRPLVFEGGNLEVNLSTSAGGSFRAEIQSPDGKPIKGFTMDDCPEIVADDIGYVVRWRGGGDLRALAGKPVRLRFVLNDADLYAFQFVPHRPDPPLPKVSFKEPAAPPPQLPEKNAGRKPFTVIQDDFQNSPAGTAPSSENLNPVNPAWAISEGSKDRVQVLNNDPVNRAAPGTGHYLKVERRNEGAGPGGRAWVRLAPADAADSENSVVEVHARIYVPSSIRHCVDIDAYDNPPNFYDRRAFHVRFYPNGAVRYYQGNDKTVPGLKLQPDTWQQVFLRARMKEARFDLTVEGKTARDLPFADSRVRRVQVIGFYPNTNNCTLYVDDVEVKVIP